MKSLGICIGSSSISYVTTQLMEKEVKTKESGIVDIPKRINNVKIDIKSSKTLLDKILLIN